MLTVYRFKQSKSSEPWRSWIHCPQSGFFVVNSQLFIVSPFSHFQIFNFGIICSSPAILLPCDSLEFTQANRGNQEGVQFSFFFGTQLSPDVTYHARLYLRCLLSEHQLLPFFLPSVLSSKDLCIWMNYRKEDTEKKGKNLLSFNSLPKWSQQLGLGQAEVKPGASSRSPTWIHGFRGSSNWTTFHCFLRHISRQSDGKWSCGDWKRHLDGMLAL